MSSEHTRRPRLRPVEAFPVEQEGRRLIALHDPCGVAQGVVTVSEAALLILAQFDGQHDLTEVQRAYAEATGGRTVSLEQLEDLVRQLDEGLFLEGPTFDAHQQVLIDAYRAAPTRRTMPDGGIGAELHQLPIALKDIVDGGQAPAPDGRLVGLIAPHLDLGRGRDCYADAYAALAAAEPPTRFVVLGTNHFGSSSSVVATTKDYETPLGVVPTDREFLDRLARRCGDDLCRHEVDHRREHSVEMQVFFLQHVFYRRPITIVPVLCPDPCGPTGTKPYDGAGVDLADFARALGDELRDDPTPTCIIAGADLSHVGPRFGDDGDLNAEFLRDVEQHDRRALERAIAGEPEAFRTLLADDGNPTRVCSAGCIYTLLVALARAHDKPARVNGRLLRYHQAVDAESGTGVTCAAVAFTLTA